MDAASYLKSQGWLGHGYSLDARAASSTEYKQKGKRGLAYDPTALKSQTSSSFITGGNGLVKPLLVSQKKNGFGIGKKAHEPPSGSEWWLKGFAAALGNVGKSESERSSGASTPLGVSVSVHSAYTGKHAGLYEYFTKGMLMQGTIEEKTASNSCNSSSSNDDETASDKTRKRKRDELEIASQKKSKREKLATQHAGSADKPAARATSKAKAKDQEQKMRKIGKTRSDSGYISPTPIPAERQPAQQNATSEPQADRSILPQPSSPSHQHSEEAAARLARKKKKRQKRDKHAETADLEALVEEELARLGGMPGSSGVDIPTTTPTPTTTTSKKFGSTIDSSDGNVSTDETAQSGGEKTTKIKKRKKKGQKHDSES